MYYHFSSNGLWFLIWLTFSLTSSARRFDHYISGDEQSLLLGPLERPYNSVGPLNPPSRCIKLFGHVSPADCFRNLHALENDEYQESRLRGEIEEAAPPGDWVYNSVWFTALREFMGPGASGAESQLHTYTLPKTWFNSANHLLENDCRITLMTSTDPGISNKDNATWLDFVEAVNNVIYGCHIDNYIYGYGQSDDRTWGGSQTFGESNKLAVFIYDQMSDFSDAIDVKAGCIRRGKDKILAMLLRFGFFFRTCSSEEEASSSPSASTPETCTQKMLQNVGVLYGLTMGSQAIATMCNGLIVDISTLAVGS
ncbi:MAG: hypothetical protein M1812_005083 [Candelaria pacifica]|nr:MAG: hypothetical protein M1812_005083 [Candelaria pacifica]